MTSAPESEARRLDWCFPALFTSLPTLKIDVCVPCGVTMLGCSGSETSQPENSGCPQGWGDQHLATLWNPHSWICLYPVYYAFRETWACKQLCTAELPFIQIVSSRAQEGWIFGTDFPGWGDMTVLILFTLFVFFLCLLCSLCRLGSFPVFPSCLHPLYSLWAVPTNCCLIV